MAKSKRARVTTARTRENGRIYHPKQRDAIHCITQDAIDLHWIPFPDGAKEFILGMRDGLIDLSALINFWSLPQNIGFTRDRRASCINRAAWYLALVYSKIGLYREARSLTVNGSFIHQCSKTSIEDIIALCAAGGPRHKLPYFSRVAHSICSPQAMESFIRSYLPPEDTHLMTSYTNMHDKNYVMGYIGQISDDWNDGPASSSKKVHRHSLPTDDETQITLTLVDDLDKDNRHSFNIGSMTTLKALFNDYADKRGISLRSLRFSYMDKTLFLSNVGCKTPNELGIRDHDVIVVHDTMQSKSMDDDRPSQRPTPQKTKAKKKSNKKARRKSKKPQRLTGSVKTLEEYKVQHSTQLTKIHGEAQEQLGQIRQRLNNLLIERSQPKIKSRRPRSPKKEPSLPSLAENPFKEGLGGKAGKSRFEIQVGEVKNLYKTAKLSTVASSNCSSPSTLLTLDLHGCTKQEALAKLDDTLEVWVNTAMQGPYPFVLPATIICGCGNQILSETVHQWIRSNDKVSNAPKIRQSRQ